MPRRLSVDLQVHAHAREGGLLPMVPELRGLHVGEALAALGKAGPLEHPDPDQGRAGGVVRRPGVPAGADGEGALPVIYMIII